MSPGRAARRANEDSAASRTAAASSGTATSGFYCASKATNV